MQCFKNVGIQRFQDVWWNSSISNSERVKQLYEGAIPVEKVIAAINPDVLSSSDKVNVIYVVDIIQKRDRGS